MLDRQLNPEKIKLVITEIRKNEFNIPTEVIDRFLNDLYFKWLEQKVADILK
jgi:hypothetical protein